MALVIDESAPFSTPGNPTGTSSPPSLPTEIRRAPIIQWAIHRLGPQVEILEPEFSKRSGSVKEFLNSYDPDVMLVFIHRDSEKLTLEERMTEVESVNRSNIVPVVPVRMSEAWILFSGAAIARAAGSSASSAYAVSTPRVSDIETMSNPKRRLDTLLLEAAGSPSGRRGRNLKRSIIERHVSGASFIFDYSPLENLEVFLSFQDHLERYYPYKHVIGL